MKYWNKNHKKVMKHWTPVLVENMNEVTIKMLLQRLPLDGKFYIKRGGWLEQFIGNCLTVYFQEPKHAVLFKLKWS